MGSRYSYEYAVVQDIVLVLVLVLGGLAQSLPWDLGYVSAYFSYFEVMNWDTRTVRAYVDRI